MAASGSFFLVTCFALLLTVRALTCYTKVESKCSPDGPICDTLATLSINAPMTKTECDAGVTWCSLTTTTANVQGFDFQSVVAGCEPNENDIDLKNHCYDRKEIEALDMDTANVLKQFEQAAKIKLDSVEVCMCDGNLCNGSLKSVLSISVVILSVGIGFILSF